MERAGSLARHFEVVEVLPPSEAEAVRILTGAKELYERFHGVVYSDESIPAAVSASRWFLGHRQLPGRVFDLIDDAGALVKLRLGAEPPEMAAIEKRIRFIIRQMEGAIASHDFQKARSLSDKEREERENLRRLREEQGPTTPRNIVTPEYVAEAAAARAGASATAVTSLLARKAVIAGQLAAQIPVTDRDWIESLAGYLATASAEEAEKVAKAIRGISF
jgi:ATP-dependent Clp protease ATP-binding subunit ClpC